MFENNRSDSFPIGLRFNKNMFKKENQTPERMLFDQMNHTQGFPARLKKDQLCSSLLEYLRLLCHKTIPSESRLYITRPTDREFEKQMIQLYRDVILHVLTI